MTMTHLPPDDGRHTDGDRELRALAQLFDAVAPTGRAEAEEELLDTGLDPQGIGERLDRLANRALAGLASDGDDAVSVAQPAHARIRPLHLLATAAMVLLALAGLRLLHGRAPETIPPRAASDSVSGSRGEPEHHALREPSMADLNDEGSNAGRPATGAPKAQQESIRPPRERHDGETEAATPSAVAPAVEGAATVNAAQGLVDAVVRTARSFHDTTQQLRMTVVQAETQQVTRLQLQTKIFDGGALKVAIHFLPPPDKGVAALLLEWAADNAPSAVPFNAWSYIPSLKRVRRLTYTSCTLTADLTCLDLLLPREFLPWAVANWSARPLEEAPDAVVIDLVPRPNGPRLQLPDYQRLRIRVQPTNATLREVEFFDQRDALAKTLLLSNFRNIDGVLVAHRLEMVDLLTNSRTLLEVVAFRHDENLADDLFTIHEMIDSSH
jgi:hypothetical protein